MVASHKRYGAFILLLAFSVLIALVFLVPRKPSSPGDNHQKQPAELTSEGEIGPITFATMRRGADKSASGAAVTATNGPEAYLEKLRQAFENQNVPIKFFGEVVDQFGQPIPGVRIILSIRQWQYRPATQPPGTRPKFEFLTDADGKFQLLGAKGDALDIETVEKAGYLLSPKCKKGYAYGQSSQPFYPDANSPVVIRMWRQGPREALISGEKVFGIIPDGRAYTLDLLQGKKIEGEVILGDLRVRVVRPPDATPRSKYDWSFAIEGLRGGLAETNDEFMYAAPQTGYQEKFEMRLTSSDPSWTSLVKKQFYFRSRDGQVYGRIQVEVNAIYNTKSAIEVVYAVNPANSRNLQP